MKPVTRPFCAILAAALAAPLAAGCLAPNSITCSNGVICPVGKVCDVAAGGCAFPAQVAACASLDEGAECMVERRPGVCRSGVCTQFQCNNGVVDEKEQCDGNNLGGATCQKEGYYGGTLACSNSCIFDTSGCLGYCGDGVINGPELCDGVAPDPSRLSCVGYGWDRGNLDCSMACQPTSGGCVKFGWTMAPPAPLTETTYLDGVWTSGPNDVWVFANTTSPGVVDGFILRFDGTTWSWVGRSPAARYQAIGGSGPDDVFIASTSPAPSNRLTIDHWDGTATTPGVYTQTPPIAIQAIWGSGHDDAFAVGEGILHWDGMTWSPMVVDRLGPPLNPETFSSVWGSGANDVFVASTYGRILHWDRKTWTVSRAGADHVVGAPRLSGHGRDNAYLVVGQLILHWDGVDWTALDTVGLPSAPVGAWGSGSDDVFAVLRDGTFTHWDGAGWTTQKEGDVRHDVRAVAWSDGGAFAVGHDAHQPPPPTGCPSDRPIQPSNCAAPDGATLGMRWDGNGWFPIAADPPSGIDLHAGWAAGERDLYALGRAADGASVIAHWDGRHWASVADSLPRLSRIRGVGGAVYAAGQGLYQWTGTSASQVAAGEFSGVWGSGADDVFAWGPGGISHRDGSGWATTDASPGVFNDVWGSARGDAFAVGRGGAIARWDGSHWSRMVSGTAVDLHRVWGRGPFDVFAAGARGTLLRWNGDVWSVMVTPVTADFVYVGGDAKGDVFAATDDQLLHLISGVWERVALPDVGAIRDLWATRTRLFVFGSAGRAYLNRASISCAAPERDCHDGWDNDCDGLQDRDDPDCKIPENCANYADDDGDGAVDCADSECADFPYCAAQ